MLVSARKKTLPPVRMRQPRSSPSSSDGPPITRDD
jgi:hypothetical protein